jgi:hypothetical protein
MKKIQKTTTAKKPAKTAKKTAAKKAPKTRVVRKAKDEEEDGPLMVHTSMGSAVKPTRSRRNRAGSIERTGRFDNIDNGLIPFNYATGSAYKSSNLTIRDSVILCQKAYYNFGIFRHTIDLMTEFSSGEIYLRGGSKKSRDFFEALFKKIDLWSIRDRFFREYYRSGNVFVYRFDATLDKGGVTKLTQTFGSNKIGKKKLPLRYLILNPADIQVGGNVSFASGTYYKVLTDYELERLRNPRSEEDREVFLSLDSEIREAIQKKQSNQVLLPLNKDRIHAVFYKRQDYEPFAVPMGYPVLDDINWKAEMKKMDMAVARTMQQAILLVTMGAEPDKGGINQKNLQAMQSLFQNESVGRVLIADYTTKAEFVIPNIASLLDAKKYEVVDRDIAMGLNNMLLGHDNKFANQSLKIQVFLARLRQARQAFLNEFLQPEIKRVAREIGLKNYPVAHFDDVSLSTDPNITRIYARLIEMGILTPAEGVSALESGRLPTPEESVESQTEYKKLRDKGFYEPMMGGPQTQVDLVDKTQKGQMELQHESIKSQEKMGKEKMKSEEKKAAAKPAGTVPPKAGAKTPKGQTGRPGGSSSPQTTKKVSPQGQGPQSKAELYSIAEVKNTFIEVEKLNKKVESQLLRKHKLKSLSKDQRNIAEQITHLVIANEDPKNWTAKKIRDYMSDPKDKNPERIKDIQSIAYEHQVDDYLATVLYLSKAKGDEKK